jgi:hypothetical protein
MAALISSSNRMDNDNNNRCMNRILPQISSRNTIHCSYCYSFIDVKWYTWQTGLRLVQGYGRSIRSKEDFAKTYVLDSAFGPFVDRNTNIPTLWFIQAINWICLMLKDLTENFNRTQISGLLHIVPFLFPENQFTHHL